MKTHPFLSCLILAFIHFTFPFSSIGQANNTNGNNIDIKFVRFNMLVDPALAGSNANFLRGAVTFYFETKQASVQTLKFDFYKGNTGNFTPHSMSGDSIRYHGTKINLAAGNHVNDTLIINLPAAINPVGRLDSVTIYYHGAPYQNTGSSRGYYKTSVATSGNLVTTHSAGYYGRQWWPCKHNMTDKIDSVEFLITAPSAYKAVANGVLLNGPTPATDINGNKTWHWKTRYPIAHYLIAYAVHNYTIHTSPSANVNGTVVPIVNYLTATANTATRRNNCDAMKGVLEHFSTLFGDYPFKNEKYGHVAYTFGGGMENQTASYIGETVFDNRSTLAHELAHQWFGDRVTCSKWNNNWVNEGFARHAEILYSEQFETAAAAITKRQGYKSGGSVQNASNTVYRYDVEVVNIADHGSKIFYSPMVYDKAAIVICMLRRLVGNVKFFQALRNYLNDPLISYGYATTEDVRRHFEAVSGKDLTAFFDDFIYKAGYPTYNVQWAYSPGVKRVGIKLNQSKTTSGTYAVAGRYHTVLPIRLLGPTLDTVIVAYDDGVASLSLLQYKVSSAVTSIQVDPYSESYSYTNTSTLTPALAITLPVNLLEFDASRKEENVVVTWKTNDETNFSHYEIEHSADGQSFSKIAALKATDPGPAIKEYEFIHSSPASGYNYYRLKMLDIDGKVEYSMIATVIMQAVTKVKIVPNPANNFVRLTIPGVNSDVRVKLINLQGQVIEITGIKAGENTLEMNVKSIPAGNYWLELQVNGNKIVERILIQH